VDHSNPYTLRKYGASGGDLRDLLNDVWVLQARLLTSPAESRLSAWFIALLVGQPELFG
jgi:hypothetical protein